MPVRFPGERIRKNHALEHATIAILQEHNPSVRMIGRSNHHGFRLYGTAAAHEVQAAVEEALQRLNSGEGRLAIAPRCGTNIAVGVLVGTLGLWLNEFTRSPRQKVVLGLATSVAIALSSQPVGLLAQRYVTTQARLDGLRVQGFHTRHLGKRHFLEILTK